MAGTPPPSSSNCQRTSGSLVSGDRGHGVHQAKGRTIIVLQESPHDFHLQASRDRPPRDESSSNEESR